MIGITGWLEPSSKVTGNLQSNGHSVVGNIMDLNPAIVEQPALSNVAVFPSKAPAFAFDFWLISSCASFGFSFGEAKQGA